MNNEIEKVIKDYMITLKKLMIYFVAIFIFFGVDVFTFVLAFHLQAIITLTNENEWVFLLPLTLVWVAAVYFSIKIIERKRSLNNRINSIILNHTKSKRELGVVYNNLMWRYKSQNGETFDKFLLSFILFYLPIIIRYHFINSINREETFKYSGLLILCWAYFSHFFNFCKSKFNKGVSKMKIYLRISITDPSLFNKTIKLEKEAQQM
jgi:hypothetical protein